jgi:hypothetical protein
MLIVIQWNASGVVWLDVGAARPGRAREREIGLLRASGNALQALARCFSGAARRL